MKKVFEFIFGVIMTCIPLALVVHIFYIRQYSANIFEYALIGGAIGIYRAIDYRLSKYFKKDN